MDAFGGQAQLRGGLLLGDALVETQYEYQPLLGRQPPQEAAGRRSPAVSQGAGEPFPPGGVREVGGHLLARAVVRVLAAQPVPGGVRTGQRQSEQVFGGGRGTVLRLRGQECGGVQQTAGRARDERLELPGTTAFLGCSPLSHSSMARQARHAVKRRQGKTGGAQGRPRSFPSLSLLRGGRTAGR